MPSKQLSLFDVEGKEPSKPKKPTLRQFIKEQTDAKYPLSSTIRLVWFPGNWDNYSLETDSFRVSIGVSHPLYAVLDKLVIKSFCESQTAIHVVVKDGDGTIGFGESTLYGAYVRVGNAGLKFDETPLASN